MALLKKRGLQHPLDRASEKAAGAHNLFKDAFNALNEANGILTNHVVDNTQWIEKLQAEVEDAASNISANQKLADKLSEFVS